MVKAISKILTYLCVSILHTMCNKRCGYILRAHSALKNNWQSEIKKNNLKEKNFHLSTKMVWTADLPSARTFNTLWNAIKYLLLSNFVISTWSPLIVVRVDGLTDLLKYYCTFLLRFVYKINLKKYTFVSAAQLIFN